LLPSLVAVIERDGRTTVESDAPTSPACRYSMPPNQTAPAAGVRRPPRIKAARDDRRASDDRY
jgi:hypothetical protein